MASIRLRDANGDWQGRRRLHGKELAHIWGQWLGRIRWEFFVTLTFDPKRRFPVGRDLASREAFEWLCLVAHLCRRPVAWAYVAERGKSGLWHAHAVLIDVGRPNWGTLEGAWRMRNGQASVRPIDSATTVALYTTKQAIDGEVVLSDTVTLERFPALAPEAVVLLAREGQ